MTVQYRWYSMNLSQDKMATNSHSLPIHKIKIKILYRYLQDSVLYNLGFGYLIEPSRQVLHLTRTLYICSGFLEGMDGRSLYPMLLHCIADGLQYSKSKRGL